MQHAVRIRRSLEAICEAESTDLSYMGGWEVWTALPGVAGV